MRLESDQLDQLAILVADRLATRLAGDLSEELISPSELARRYGVTRSWAYEHADELGALRIGTGPRPRLRFRPAVVERVLAVRAEPETPTMATPRSRPSRADRTAAGAPLLPVAGLENE